METTTLYPHGDYREGVLLGTPRVTIGRPHTSNKPKWNPKAAMGLIALVAAISVGWVAHDLASGGQPTLPSAEAPAASQTVDQIGNVHLGDGFGAILALDPSSAAVRNVHLGDGFGAILALDPSSAAVRNVHLGDGFGAILALDPSSEAVGNVHLGTAS